MELLQNGLQPHSGATLSVTGRMRRMDKVLFLQVSVFAHLKGGVCTPSPSYNTSSGTPVPGRGRGSPVPNGGRGGAQAGGNPVPCGGTTVPDRGSQPWGNTHGQDKTGVHAPPPRDTEHQREYLVRGKRYASCVQAGGLASSQH